jgi:membrane-associated phospholipid phosphatase
MTLAGVLQSILLVTIGLSALGFLVIVGPERVRTMIRQRRDRLRDAVPYIALLGGVLLVNSQARSAVRELSWTVGIELTVAIYALEGDLVPWVQSFAATPLTTFFSVQYIYGYVFLLVFPLIAYLALADRTPFRRLCLAYTFNYAFGLVLYVLFVAYGPRNLLPGAVDSLLYTSWPEAKLLTTQMNTNTNVFPSLHTSLSTTVVLIAYRTQQPYPVWFFLSTGIAASIVVATLYLGIHWGTDTLAGVLLAVASVAASRRYDPIQAISARVETQRAKRAIESVRDSIRG